MKNIAQNSWVLFSSSISDLFCLLSWRYVEIQVEFSVRNKGQITKLLFGQFFVLKISRNKFFKLFDDFFSCFVLILSFPRRIDEKI